MPKNIIGNKMPLKKLARNLKTLRNYYGINQEELAQQFCIKRTTYTKYETGVNEPNLYMLQQFADFYKIDYNTLFCNDEQLLCSILEGKGVKLNAEKQSG